MKRNTLYALDYDVPACIYNPKDLIVGAHHDGAVAP